MEVYVVNCFWYDDSEVKVFSTYKAAFEYMKKDFLDNCAEYGFSVDNDIVKNEHGEDISDITYIIDCTAQIRDVDMDVDDRLTWKLFSTIIYY